jgi:hypothetical protein
MTDITTTAAATLPGKSGFLLGALGALAALAPLLTASCAGRCTGCLGCVSAGAGLAGALVGAQAARRVLCGRRHAGQASQVDKPIM